MFLTIWSLATLMLVSMNKAMGRGHLLQLPSRMHYDNEVFVC
jgi:hypothetical protein